MLLCYVFPESSHSSDLFHRCVIWRNGLYLDLDRACPSCGHFYVVSMIAAKAVMTHVVSVKWFIVASRTGYSEP